MGYDRELVTDNIQSLGIDFHRGAATQEPWPVYGHPSGRWGDIWRMVHPDRQGWRWTTGIAPYLHDRQDRQIVMDEDANRIKFALFSCDPIAHTIVGDSLTDYTKDIQRIKTAMMRAILDSAAESINPKTVINELLVNLDDAMNDDLGAVIRSRGDPVSAVMPFRLRFSDRRCCRWSRCSMTCWQRRTGLTDAAKGLDPKALQSRP